MLTCTRLAGIEGLWLADQRWEAPPLSHLTHLQLKHAALLLQVLGDLAAADLGAHHPVLPRQLPLFLLDLGAGTGQSQCFNWPGIRSQRTALKEMSGTWTSKRLSCKDLTVEPVSRNCAFWKSLPPAQLEWWREWSNYTLRCYLVMCRTDFLCYSVVIYTEVR